MIDSSAARASGLVGSIAVRRRLQRRRFHRFDLDADLVEEIGDIGILEQHADRADQRGLLRHDVIAGERGDVAARRRQAVDHDHQRLFLTEPRQRVVELLGTGGGAAGAVDVDDDGPGERGFGQPVELLATRS